MKCLYLFLLMAALPFCSGQVSDERVSQDAYLVESAFLKEAWDLFDEGEKCMEQGFSLQANYYYGQAVVAVASFRYAVNEILMMHKKEAEAKARVLAEGVYLNDKTYSEMQMIGEYTGALDLLPAYLD